MTDRVYPSAKPNPPPAATSFPAPKSQAYTRPAYRPQPPSKRRRSRRGCWCCCCLWSTLILIVILFLAAIACGVFYVLYQPHRPTFKVSSIRLSNFNITKSNTFITKIDLTVAAKNSNKKIDFFYDQINVAAFSNDVSVGTGSFPAFALERKNTTVMKTTVSNSETLDSDVAAAMKKKSKLPIRITLDTKAGVKFAGIKTKKIGIEVNCEGFDLAVPKKKADGSSTSDVSCKVKLRIKIWKWTI